MRLDFDTHGAAFEKALTHLDNAATRDLDAAGIDRGLRDLLKLRVSQINGCAFCVDMHTKDARAKGESDERITGLPVWAETPFYSDAERAALGFAEAMATMSVSHVPRAAYDEVAAHWEEPQIAALVALVVAISAWNAVGVSVRPWEPGSYQP